MHQDYFPPGIVVLTGAGISKESGIDTFRDRDGLWNRVNLEDVATIEAWHRDKKKVLDFYNEARGLFRAAHVAPNLAHDALARLEARYGGDVTIVTQNIDPLHEMAGSKNVLHMHGRGLRAAGPPSGACAHGGTQSRAVRQRLPVPRTCLRPGHAHRPALRRSAAGRRLEGRRLVDEQ